MNDIYYRTFCGPLSCRGFVVKDAAGDYTVFLNEDLSPAAMERARKHELEHIARGDLDSGGLGTKKEKVCSE